MTKRRDSMSHSDDNSVDVQGEVRPLSRQPIENPMRRRGSVQRSIYGDELSIKAAPGLEQGSGDGKAELSIVARATLCTFFADEPTDRVWGPLIPCQGLWHAGWKKAPQLATGAEAEEPQSSLQTRSCTTLMSRSHSIDSSDSTSRRGDL